MTDDPAGMLVEMVRRSASGLVDGMYVTLPAVVERYDADRQCVDAQPTIMRERPSEDGATIVERLPVVTRVPVVFQGSGSYRQTFPIEVGSMVILHFTSASMDRWLSIGGKDVEPRDDRRHDTSSAFAMPGGHSFGGSTAPSTTAPTDAWVTHAPAIKLGGPGATHRVAREPDLRDFMTILSGVTDSAGACAALHSALDLAGWPDCTSIVKAE